MNLTLDITIILSVIITLISIIVYHFDRIIVNVSSNETEVHGYCINGAIFIFSFVLLPFTVAFGSILTIIHISEYNLNTLQLNGQVSLITLLMPVFFITVLHFYLLFLSRKYSITEEMGLVKLKQETNMKLNYMLDSYFISFIISIFCCALYYLILTNPSAHMGLVLFSIGAILIAFVGIYTLFAYFYGLHIASYPYAKISLLTDSPCDMQGNIRKFGRQLELVTEKETYYINRDNINYIKILNSITESEEEKDG
ncbi:hypothetical protein V7O66_03070 [Methanolobus sp. ZRKC3]|uniref:hypothetical protein n=1 Tax=Methanolobus sp. ZRKC3 TaxID=3125786 RepID=UPI0032550A00